MTHQLLHLPTLTLLTQPVEQWPAFRSIGNPEEWDAPPDHAYVPILPQPPYDPAIQSIARKVTTTAHGWTVRALTAAELSERAAAKAAADADTSEETAIRATLTALKNGTGTAAERLARIERVVFRLAKQSIQ